MTCMLTKMNSVYDQITILYICICVGVLSFNNLQALLEELNKQEQEAMKVKNEKQGDFLSQLVLGIVSFFSLLTPQVSLGLLAI